MTVRVPFCMATNEVRTDRHARPKIDERLSFLEKWSSRR
jgi:hypothetical protein